MVTWTTRSITTPGQPVEVTVRAGSLPIAVLTGFPTVWQPACCGSVVGSFRSGIRPTNTPCPLLAQSRPSPIERAG